VAVVCRSSDLLVCCGVWYFLFDDIIDVGYKKQICLREISDTVVFYILLDKVSH
jgi:hypothetical protein